MSNCPQCSSPCQAEYTFCPMCGRPLAAPTIEPDPAPEITTLDQAIQRLIPKEYAQRLLAARGKVPSERRTVTILFADVCGSTAMAENLDPEDVMDIMNGAFHLLIEPVTRHEGTLARLMGDGVLALFGAPLAHEDDAVRAVLAALDITTEARRYGERLEAERGIEGFDVRVGIHTGLVVVGEVGSDLRVEYTAMGDAVNLAARLEQAAEPGTILISEATLSGVAPFFETEALGPVTMKGKAQPVPVYHVQTARPVQHKPRGIPGLESPLVGRETESAALADNLARLLSGQGSIVALTGEAGIGKSRLVVEAQRQFTVGAPGGAPRLPTNGTPDRPPNGTPGGTPTPPTSGTPDGTTSSPPAWTEGRCLSYGASLPYLLWLDILRGLLHVTLDDSPTAVAGALQAQVSTLCPDRFDAVYPYLARIMSLPLDPKTEEFLDELDGRTLRDNTFSAFESLLSCTAGHGPQVLVCEDLHWADPTSLQLLEHLLPLSSRLPILFLCIARPVREHPFWSLRQRMMDEYQQDCTVIDLEALSAADSQDLVSHLLSVHDLPVELKDLILSRAEGNPFYLEEILRSLIDQGAISQDKTTGRWQATVDVDQILIPDTLEGVLVARIDRLQEETRRILQLASVIGRVFLYRILETIAQAERDLDGRLTSLQEEQMIRERARIPELEFIFKHDLTREAAYNGLLKRDRRGFHRQVGAALEDLFADRLDDMLGLLAHHWERAGVADKAIPYLSRAGDQARLAYALTEAVDYFQRLLKLQKKGQLHRQAARTLMKLGLTYQHAFQFERSQQAYKEGFALWQKAGREKPVALPAPPHALRIAPFGPLGLAPASTGYYEVSCGLVELTADDGIMPDVARSWDVQNGGRTHVFHLREDARWSDGVPLTARDFEFTWKRVLDPALDLRFATLFYDIKGARAYHQGQVTDPDSVGVRARNDLTLVVELEAPVAYFLQVLACPASFPLPQHVVEACGQAWREPANFASNGPFRIAEWPQDRSTSIVRDPTYHGRTSGNVEQVEFIARADRQDREFVDMYEAGQLDLLYLGFLDIPEVVRAQRRNASDFVKISQWAALFYLGFNVLQPPFDDVRVRRAFAHSLDRKAVDTQNLVEPPPEASGGFVPPGMPGHSPGIALADDLEMARHLLAEAGYPGGRGFPKVECLSLVGWFDNSIRSDWESHWVDRLGIEVDWVKLSYQEALERARAGQAYLFFDLWTPKYPDPDSLMRHDFPWQITGFADKTYRNLVDEASRTLDQPKRMELYRQADKVLIEQAVVAPTEYGGHWWLIKPWITRFPCATALKFVFYKDIIIEPH